MLHGTWSSVSSPKQGFPPLAGFGLEQVLDLFWTPPKQGLLHTEYALHADQFPSKGFVFLFQISI